MAKTRTSRHLLIAAQILISSVLLLYLLQIIPFQSLRDAALGTDAALLVVGTVAMLSVHWLASLQLKWTLLPQGISIGSLQVLRINLIAMFYSLFLPTLIGGAGVRWYHLSRFSRGPIQSLAAIVFNRTYDTLLLVAFGIIALLANFQLSIESNAIVGFLLLFVIAQATYLLAFNRRVHAWCKNLADIVPMPEIVRGWLMKFIDALSQFDSLGSRFHVKLLAVGIFRHVLSVALVMLFVYAVNIEISVLTIAWIRSLVAMLEMLPFSIAGLGIREATLVITLGQFGVPAEQAFLLSLLLFARTAVYGMVGGIIEGIRVFWSHDSTEALS